MLKIQDTKEDGNQENKRKKAERNGKKNEKEER